MTLNVWFSWFNLCAGIWGIDHHNRFINMVLGCETQDCLWVDTVISVLQMRMCGAFVGYTISRLTCAPNACVRHCGGIGRAVGSACAMLMHAGLLLSDPLHLWCPFPFSHSSSPSFFFSLPRAQGEMLTCPKATSPLPLIRKNTSICVGLSRLSVFLYTQNCRGRNWQVLRCAGVCPDEPRLPRRGRLVYLIHAAQETQSISFPGRSVSATGFHSPCWLTGTPLNAPSFVPTDTVGDATVSVYTCELRVLGYVGVSLRKW